MENFYVTLPSSVKDPQTTNTSSQYVTRLPQVLNLERDKWVVALSDIIYPYSFENVGQALSFWIHFKEAAPIHVTFPAAQYGSIEDVVNQLNSQRSTRLKRSAVDALLFDKEPKRSKRAEKSAAELRIAEAEALAAQREAEAKARIDEAENLRGLKEKQEKGAEDRIDENEEIRNLAEKEAREKRKRIDEHAFLGELVIAYGRAVLDRMNDAEKLKKQKEEEEVASLARIKEAENLKKEEENAALARIKENDEIHRLAEEKTRQDELKFIWELAIAYGRAVNQQVDEKKKKKTSSSGVSTSANTPAGQQGNTSAVQRGASSSATSSSARGASSSATSSSARGASASARGSSSSARGASASATSSSARGASASARGSSSSARGASVSAQPKPANQQGNQPGNQPATNQSPQPGSQQAPQQAPQPGNQAPPHPGHHPAAPQPGNQPAGHPANNQADEQRNPQPGNQPNLGNEPIGQQVEKPAQQVAQQAEQHVNPEDVAAQERINENERIRELAARESMNRIEENENLKNAAAKERIDDAESAKKAKLDRIEENENLKSAAAKERIDEAETVKEKVRQRVESVIEDFDSLQEMKENSEKDWLNYRNLRNRIINHLDKDTKYEEMKNELVKYRNMHYVRTMSNVQEYLSFSNNKNQISITFKKPDEIAFVEFDKPCAYFLGFTDTIVRKSGQAAKNVDFFGNVSALYLYCDCVEPNFIGNELASLLSIIPCSGNYGDMIRHTITHPRYYPIMNSSIDSIKIQLLSEFAEPIDFHWGTTIVVLHFKKVI